MAEFPAHVPCDPLRVVIVGGGVAALEALIALASLAPGRVAVTLISGCDALVYRPLEVGQPFGLGAPRRYRLPGLCACFGARVVLDRVVAVDAQTRAVRTAGDASIAYDKLLLAPGARPYPAFEHGVTFERQVSPKDFDEVVADLGEGLVPRIAIVVPDGVSWTLPAYELALLSAAWVERRHPDAARVTLVTPEPAPLAAFGARVSREVREILALQHVVVRCGVHPDVVTPTSLRAGGAWMEADRIVSLPLLAGPKLAGVPADARGFLPVDGYGRVDGLEDVYAAGDGTTFPVKQGGLAAQQAEVAARHIAATAGADVEPRPLQPVLRGLLAWPGGSRFLRAELDDVEATSTIDARPLWWPPSKIATHWLAPHLGRLERESVRPPANAGAAR